MPPGAEAGGTRGGDDLSANATHDAERTQCATPDDAARGILRSIFGFEDFRTGQEEVVASVLQGNDTLAVMPTSGGKSLCYQVPALMGEGGDSRSSSRRW
jgi:superfamily II DNA helicase RecQ